MKNSKRDRRPCRCARPEACAPRDGVSGVENSRYQRNRKKPRVFHWDSGPGTAQPSGISAATRAKIVRMPSNWAIGRSCSPASETQSSKRKISVHLAAGNASFFDALRGGIRQPAWLQPPLEVEFHSYPGHGTRRG